MSGEIVVNYGTILRAAEDTSKSSKELGDRFEQLKADLNPLVHTWDGAAKNAWNARQLEWNTALEELNSLLARLAIALPEIADGYQNTDKGVQQMFE